MQGQERVVLFGREEQAAVVGEPTRRKGLGNPSTPFSDGLRRASPGASQAFRMSSHPHKSNFALFATWRASETRLEVHFGAQLDDSGVSVAGDLAEERTGVVGRTEGAGVGVIQDVGGLSSELEAEALFGSEAYVL